MYLSRLSRYFITNIYTAFNPYFYILGTTYAMCAEAEVLVLKVFGAIAFKANKAELFGVGRIVFSYYLCLLIVVV